MNKELETTFNSRQFMVARDFELYYYNDSQYLKIPPHTHPYYEFYFFLEGNANYEIDNQITPLRYGDFAVVPPGVVHRAKINDDTKPYRRFIFWVKEEYLQRWITDCPSIEFLIKFFKGSSRKFIFRQDSVSFNSILRDIVRLLEEMHNQKYGREDMISLRSLDLLLHLNRLIHDAIYPPTAKEDTALYVKVCEYIENYLENDLSLERLADEFYVSKYHLAHNFKDNLGVSVHQYILKKRLLACQNAIMMNEPISKVYTLYGFHDYPGFYRAFKKEFGLGPKEFRKQTLTLTRAATLPSSKANLL